MKLWKVAPLDKEAVKRIQTEYDLSAIAAMLLKTRGIASRAEIADFLYNESKIADPFEFADMEKAVGRVSEAIFSGERICVYGDYDADGVTSTALLYSYLITAGANVRYYIPSRENEGYGMNTGAVDRLHGDGVSLIITVDNGIAAVKEIEYAASLGIDTVVTDHHQPLGVLPKAVAVVDPHRSDCKSRFKLLSGVGVAFKLIMALEGEDCDTDYLLEQYSDLLSLGTIGDIVELKGENRVFVKRGLQSMEHTTRPGISALIKKSGIGTKSLTAGRVSFSMVPRINAVGRLGESSRSVRLLLTEDEGEAEKIAGVMDFDNSERRGIENDIVEAIDAAVRRDPSLVRSKVIVIDGEGWHQGVIGIVASRIKEAFGKPAIIISRSGELAKGSGRSVEGFPLCDAVAYCSKLLTHFGGHPMAAGLSLSSENIPLFRKKINEFAAALPEMPFDALKIECKLNPKYISTELVEDIELLQPFGAGNPAPVFGLFEMTIAGIVPLSNNKHLRLTLRKHNSSITAMLFFTAPTDFIFKKGDVIDAAVSLDINEYNGTESVSVIIRDIKPSSSEPAEMIKSVRIFEDICTGAPQSPGALRSVLPDRNDFAKIYRFLRSNGGWHGKPELLVYALNNSLSYGKIRVALEAFGQLGLINAEEGLKSLDVTLRQTDGKSDLNSAPIISTIRRYLHE